MINKKNFFLLFDTETAQSGEVADFGAVIVDKHGKIYKECAVMIAGVFKAKPLFFDSMAPANATWSSASAKRREASYMRQLDHGQRMLASVPAVNAWLAKCLAEYNPVLTAYNLAFDIKACQLTGIDLSNFSRRFCLMNEAISAYHKRRDYRAFVLEHHLFNPPTDRRNMTFQCTAETIGGFLKGSFLPEPHTAIEDCKDFELPILVDVLKRRTVKEILKGCAGVSWRQRQVKAWFKPA